jgi:hypothetical protein
MNPMTAHPSSQPSFGSDFEPKSLEQLIEETMDAMRERGCSNVDIAAEIARVAKAMAEKEEPSIERAAQCPKCRERTGFRVNRSTWLDAGKARERTCKNPKCGYFFRTFEPFPKFEDVIKPYK